MQLSGLRLFLLNCIIVSILAGCQTSKPTPIPSATPTVGRTATVIGTATIGSTATIERTTTSQPPTSTPYAGVTIEINPDQTRQTIKHIGSGNFIHFFGGSLTALEPISQLDVEILRPQFARVRIEMPEWEPTNDDSDPGHINPSGFIDDRHNRATFELMKIFRDQGVELTASIWQVPDWLVENPGDESPRTIARSMYPEAVESIAAWLLHTKQQYGVEVDYVSFNEADIGVTVLLTSADYVEMIRLGGKRFAELGLKTKWLIGDCSSLGGCLDYVKPIWAVEDIKPYLGPFSFHNWDGTRAGDQTIQAIGDWASEQGLETRCTEGGWDPQLWQRSQEFPSWSNALNLMASYNRVLKMSRATVFYYWQMMGEDYALNNGAVNYPSLEMLRQLNEAFPTGTKIVATSPNRTNVYFVAGITPDGFALHIVNVSATDKINISGIPNGTYELLISTKDFLNQLQIISITDNTTSFNLPGSSVGLLLARQSVSK